MYLDYYRFDREPFHITPDPKFLYLSPSHKEALASIIYGIENRKGFVCILGEVGLGKTTIVRSYLELADRDEIRPIYVFNSKVTFKELLETIFQEWGLKPEGDSVHSMLQQLYRELINEYNTGRNVVLLIDEAQNVPLDTLENLRMLSNLETTKRKLIQVVVIGQPELRDKLDRPELRQLKQRVVVRTTVFPLTEQESREYIRHRLSHASSRPETIFTRGAESRIVRYAKGIPRTINIIADNALIASYGLQCKPVTKNIVDQVIRDHHGEARTREPFWKPVLAALCLTGALLLPTYTYREALHQRLSAIIPAATQAMPPQGEGTAWQASPPGQASRPAPQAGQEMRTAPARPGGQGDAPQASVPMATTVEAPKPSPQPAPGAGRTEPREPAVAERPAAFSPRAGMPEEPSTREEPAPASPAQGLATQTGLAWANLAWSDAARVTAQPGDYLTKLCIEAYGFCGQRELTAILGANPSIVDPDYIAVGQVLIIPPLGGN
ncbi:AAA family ATPase [Desulfocurvibacter africanus]|uniref:Peptidoglycan-binding lysin domain-containing protein n=1 Tax=Desulfocurvibacter africanus subsp. africanus str. Walvis Bay TaxID=690850 RepID=F3YUR2_DESAF|nr:AAA family ATPase [Desulfocurvibacter africanus]EGJ49089.1 Peptidoglycan-binding lysin domain-containing protein [Desulfocurvibacter africanus subsp. africanus str. Walvis Bay]